MNDFSKLFCFFTETDTVAGIFRLFACAAQNVGTEHVFSGKYMEMYCKLKIHFIQDIPMSSKIYYYYFLTVRTTVAVVTSVSITSNSLEKKTITAEVIFSCHSVSCCVTLYEEKIRFSSALL